MARITTIKPPCGYTMQGVASIQLLDFEDFRGFGFENGDLYGNCLVTAIARVAGFTELQTPDSAKYSTAQNGKLKVHTLETFVGEISAFTLSNLNLAEKRRYVPVFRLNNGRYYTFGYDAGATVQYNNQSEDGIGHIINISAPSVYPLFEVAETALTRTDNVTEFLPDFDYGAYCNLT